METRLHSCHRLRARSVGLLRASPAVAKVQTIGIPLPKFDAVGRFQVKRANSADIRGYQ
jgi:hypothetical protein